MSTLHIVYASTSGHTEYVIQTLVAWLKEHASQVTVSMQRAEQATPEDLLKSDVLLLGSGTWNTGGPEGQLNPHMFALCMERAASVDLQKKRVAILGLGDQRYRYTAKALEHLRNFVNDHNGTVLSELKIVNEPYGQEVAVEAWGAALLSLLS